MYDELGSDGKRAHTIQRIADEFGVTRPTIYRHLHAPRPDRDQPRYLSLGAAFLNGNPYRPRKKPT